MMRVEVKSSYGRLGFVVHAENETDRAILTLFTSDDYRAGRYLGMHGHTYECDYSATTSFNFGWVDPPKPPVKSRKKK